MQEKQPRGETIREQTLRRFRSQEHAQRTEKRKKFSTGIILINVVIIFFLYMFYSGKKPGEEYQTASFNYRNAAFRFSMTHVKGSDDYLFSISTRPAGKEQVSLRFAGAIADLVIVSGQEVLLTEPMGEDLTVLTLRSGESDIRRETIDANEFMLYAQSHPDRVVSPERSFLRSAKPYLPLTAELRIRAEHPLSTSLNFKYEVKR